MTSSNMELFDANLIESVQDEDLDTDDEVLQAGINQSLEDLEEMKLKVYPRDGNRKYLSTLQNYEKILEAESNKWKNFACA